MGATREDRRALARDIHRAGTTDPELLAAFLLREGWGRRREAFTSGVTITIDAVNAIGSEYARRVAEEVRR